MKERVFFQFSFSELIGNSHNDSLIFVKCILSCSPENEGNNILEGMRFENVLGEHDPGPPRFPPQLYFALKFTLQVQLQEKNASCNSAFGVFVELRYLSNCEQVLDPV